MRSNWTGYCHNNASQKDIEHTVEQLRRSDVLIDGEATYCVVGAQCGGVGVGTTYGGGVTRNSLQSQSKLLSFSFQPKELESKLL